MEIRIKTLKQIMDGGQYEKLDVKIWKIQFIKWADTLLQEF